MTARWSAAALRSRPVKAKKCGCSTDDIPAAGHDLAIRLQVLADHEERQHHASTAQCTVAGLAVESKSGPRPENYRAYRLDVESKEGGVASWEALIARRVGDC